MKFGRNLAARVACWFAGLTLLLLALASVWSAALPLPRSGLPAPWALCGPVFVAACAVTWARAAKRGELVAVAAAGAAPRVVVLPVVGLGLALQLLLVVPAGRPPATREAGVAVQRSVGGDLFVVHRGRGVLLAADGALRVTDAAAPAGFRPAPHDPRRYRRQAFFTCAPRPWARDRYDPWLLRLVYAAAMVVVPGILMGSLRRRTWWWAAAPFLLLLGLA